MDHSKATSGPNELKTEFDAKNTCRICMKLNFGGETTDMFNSDNNIIDKVLFCTGIQFTKEDRLPHNMCKTCEEDLATAHRFKTLCLLANDTFLNIIKDGIKTEVTNDDDFEYSDQDEENDKCKLKEEISDDGVKEHIKIEIEMDSEIKTESDTIRGPYKKTAKIKRSHVDTIKKKKTSRGPYKKKDKKEGNIIKIKQFPPNMLKRLSCGHCSMKFATIELANHHRNTVHKDEVVPWICEVCGKDFKTKEQMGSHKRSHVPPHLKCPHCSYDTNNKWSLDKHMRIHTGEQNFQCEMCPARFYTGSNLSSHINRAHVRRKRFQCEQCDRGFFDRTKYNRHLDSHLSIKRFECEFCHSAFTRKCYWKKHLSKQHNVIIPPERPGRQRKNLIVDLPVTEYVKPRLIIPPVQPRPDS